MIKTEELMKAVSKYGERCREAQKEPTYSGFASMVGVSAPTIKHVYTGEYRRGKTYTNKPHVTRIISNGDFEIIKDLFDKRVNL